jgi:hypothetical protein
MRFEIKRDQNEKNEKKIVLQFEKTKILLLFYGWFFAIAL